MQSYDLILDCNYFGYKNLFWLIGKNPSNNFLVKDKDKEKLSDAIYTDVNAEIERLKGSNSNVYLVLDSISWRKLNKNFSYDEIELMQGHGYKDNRSSSEFDKEVFHEILNDVINLVASELNVDVIQVQEAEGDDIIYHLVSYLKLNERSGIIISPDKDLSSLTFFDKQNEQFIIQFNGNTKYPKLITSLGFTSYLKQNNKDISLFASNNELIKNDRKKQFIKTINDLKCDIVEIDPVFETFAKVLMGDKSDNILSVATKEKGDKIYSITKKMAWSIWSILHNIYNVNLNNDKVLDNLETQKLIAKLACKELNVYESDFNIESIMNRIKLNYKLIYLNEKVIPDSVNYKIQQTLYNI
jgi:hypothetical protein